MNALTYGLTGRPPLTLESPAAALLDVPPLLRRNAVTRSLRAAGVDLRRVRVLGVGRKPTP